MNSLDATETINSWRRVLIEGNAEDIDQMLEDVERRLGERGWARDSGTEAKNEATANRKIKWRCFVGGPKNGPRVRLGLSRVSDRRVRGETYSLLEGPANMKTTDVARVVEDVITDVLTPSASSHGLKVTIPRLGPISRVPPKTLAALRRFSDSAAGAWPLSADHDRLWRRFMISACREHATFDIDELSDWFATNGWCSQVAQILTNKFMNDASLISEYEDEGEGDR